MPEKCFRCGKTGNKKDMIRKKNKYGNNIYIHKSCKKAITKKQSIIVELTPPTKPTEIKSIIINYKDENSNTFANTSVPFKILGKQNRWVQGGKK